MSRHFFVALILSTCAPEPGGLPAGSPAGLPVDRISLPAGFSIEVYADNLPGARSMSAAPGGLIFVGTRRTGIVYALADRNNDKRADTTYVIASGLNMPNGVAWSEGSLYVAEGHRVIRFDDIANRLDDPPDPVVVSEDFPPDVGHGWKYLAIGPDRKLYVPVGAPCNVCDPADARYATIMRMNRDGSGAEVYAAGVRNSVGFDWHPGTGDLWFTDNGRDLLGDNLPPDELNRAPVAGLDFGFPHCHGGDIPDPQYGADHDCADFVPPEVKLGPHVASLGMKFYVGNMFPARYAGTIFIAEHGSWNRSFPIGYRITAVTVPDSGASSYQPFAEGWLEEEGPWGRPVDLLVLPDGSLLVSDDMAGAVYRISYAADAPGGP